MYSKSFEAIADNASKVVTTDGEKGLSLPAVPVLHRRPLQKMTAKEEEGSFQGKFVTQKKERNEGELAVQVKFIPPKSVVTKAGQTSKSFTPTPNTIQKKENNISLSDGRVQPLTPINGRVSVNDDPGLENEADAMGEKVMQMRAEHRRVRGHDQGLEQVSKQPAHIGSIVQRAIIANGQPGAGRMEEEERASFAGLLGHNGFDPLTFTAASYTVLQTDYDKLAPLDDKIGRFTAKKKMDAKQAFKTAYDSLLVKINAEVLKDGKPAWDAAVNLANQQYNSLPPIDQTNTDLKYKEIATPLWPTVHGRGAMPASFWKAVRKSCREGFGGVAAGAAAFSAECDAVYADMGAQFAAWDGTMANRGAWWGSAAPGSTAGARNVSAAVIRELERKAGASWVFTNSFTGGLSFHRARAGINFIYHMLAP
jgi:hypothetical protein